MAASSASFCGVSLRQQACADRPSRRTVAVGAVCSSSWEASRSSAGGVSVSPAFFVPKAGTSWEPLKESKSSQVFSKDAQSYSPFFVPRAGLSPAFFHPLLASVATEETTAFEDAVAVDDDTLEGLARRASSVLQGRSIFLVGMMGSGKSTVGKILAEVLGYGFLDSDLVVEKTQDSPVAEIFKFKGEAAFRDLETEVIADLSLTPGLVVATGGGAVLRQENWNCMRSGVTVWINVPIPDLAARVVSAGVQSRPLLASGEGEDPLEKAKNKLNSIWDARHELYALADVNLDLQEIGKDEGIATANVTPEATVEKMLKHIMEILLPAPSAGAHML